MAATETTVSKLQKSVARHRPVRPRILIVEDESLVAMDDQLTLESAGFETIGVVATAEEAVSIALQERPDLVLMDIQLAGARTGADAALEIFCKSKAAVRCIFATAHVDRVAKSSADLARPVGWLTKPFSAPELVGAVERGLARARLLANSTNCRTQLICLLA